MSSSRLVDQRVRRSYPQPVAAAWHRVALATTDAERIRHLVTFEEVLLRLLGTVLLADYLRGEPQERIEGVIARLDRPSLGTWTELVREIARHLGQREEPEPFLTDATDWYFDHKGKPSSAARCLDGLITLRNEDVHGKAATGSTALASRAEEMLRGCSELLEGLGWLSGYRLFRVMTQAPLRKGGAKGKLQFYVGLDAQPEPESGSWGSRLLDGGVYLVRPDGGAVLEVSPLIQVLHDAGSQQDQLYLVKQTRKGKELELVHDGTGAQVRCGVPGDDGDLPFDRWIEDRPKAELWQENPGASEVFRAPEWGGVAAGSEVLDDRFEVVEALGEGGMAQVFRVRDRWFDEEFALKVMRPEMCTDEGLLERFRREARTMRDLRHPGILEMVDTGKLEDGRLYLKMAIARGGTLRDRIGDEDVTEDRVRTWAEQAASTLAWLHERGIVHRDIKPSNFLLDDDDRLLLADFGIALKEEDARITRTLEQVGSLAYMAPEQRLGRDVTDRADVYSLALVIHVLLTGDEVAEGPGVGVEGDLGELVRRMGHADPDQRPSAGEVAGALEGGAGLRREPVPETGLALESKTDGHGETPSGVELSPTRKHDVEPEGEPGPDGDGISVRQALKGKWRYHAIGSLIGLPLSVAALAVASGSVGDVIIKGGPFMYALLLFGSLSMGAAWMLALAGPPTRRLLGAWLLGPAALVSVGSIGTGMGATMMLQALEHVSPDWQPKLLGAGSSIALLTEMSGLVLGASTLLLSVLLIAWQQRKELEGRGLSRRGYIILGVSIGVGFILWMFQPMLFGSEEFGAQAPFLVFVTLGGCSFAAAVVASGKNSPTNQRSRWIVAVCTMLAVAAAGAATTITAQIDVLRASTELEVVDRLTTIEQFSASMASSAPVPVFAWTLLAAVVAVILLARRAKPFFPFRPWIVILLVLVTAMVYFSVSWGLGLLQASSREIVPAHLNAMAYFFIGCEVDDQGDPADPGAAHTGTRIVSAVEGSPLLVGDEIIALNEIHVADSHGLVEPLHACWCDTESVEANCTLGASCLAPGSTVQMSVLRSQDGAAATLQTIEVQLIGGPEEDPEGESELFEEREDVPDRVQEAGGKQ